MASMRVDWDKDYLNKTFGDMTIIGRKPPRFVVKCNKCGKIHNLDSGGFIKGFKFKHEFICENVDKSVAQTLVGTDYDDFHIMSLYRRPHKGASGSLIYHCKCNICGVERDIQIKSVLSHVGTTHSVCKRGLYPQKLNRIFIGMKQRCEKTELW